MKKEHPVLRDTKALVKKHGLDAVKAAIALINEAKFLAALKRLK